MPGLSLAELRDLELRYDGPIPPQQLAAEESDRRRIRGHAQLLEAQALEFLDAAVRCDTEIEELSGDLDGSGGARWQREGWTARLNAVRTRLGAHISCAAEAMNRAAAVRRDLALPQHPLMILSRLLAGSPE